MSLSGENISVLSIDIWIFHILITMHHVLKIISQNYYWYNYVSLTLRWHHTTTHIKPDCNGDIKLAVTCNQKARISAAWKSKPIQHFVDNVLVIKHPFPKLEEFQSSVRSFVMSLSIVLHPNFIVNLN